MCCIHAGQLGCQLWPTGLQVTLNMVSNIAHSDCYLRLKSRGLCRASHEGSRLLAQFDAMRRCTKAMCRTAMQMLLQQQLLPCLHVVIVSHSTQPTATAHMSLCSEMATFSITECCSRGLGGAGGHTSRLQRPSASCTGTLQGRWVSTCCMAPPRLAAQACWQMPCWTLHRALQKLIWTSGTVMPA